MARVGPNEDVLQRVLPLVVQRLGPDGAALLSQVCTAWRGELAKQGFCNRTVQLCSALAEGENFARLQQKLRRLTIRTGRAHPERPVWLEANAFLQRSWGLKGNFLVWLQAASQEPATSFLSRGAASTAQFLGVQLVQWVGKPEGSYPGVCTLTGLAGVRSVAFSKDGKRIVSGSYDGIVKIWNAATGAEVSNFEGVH